MTKNTPTKIIDLAAENGDIKTYTPIFKVSPKLHVKKRPSFSCQPPNLPWNSVVFRKIQPVLPSFVLCISWKQRTANHMPVLLRSSLKLWGRKSKGPSHRRNGSQLMEMGQMRYQGATQDISKLDEVRYVWISEYWLKQCIFLGSRIWYPYTKKRNFLDFMRKQTHKTGMNQFAQFRVSHVSFFPLVQLIFHKWGTSHIQLSLKSGYPQFFVVYHLFPYYLIATSGDDIHDLKNTSKIIWYHLVFVIVYPIILLYIYILVGGFKHLLCSIIYGIILPIDELIFFKMVFKSPTSIYPYDISMFDDVNPQKRH